MTLAYNETFDEILSNILTDYENLDSSPSVSQGSMPFINGSILASMVYGVFKHCSYDAKNMFPDTADHEYLLRWGALYEVVYLDTDTDATYLNKVLKKIRQADAGGNAQDFETWALDQDECYYTYNDVTYYNGFAKVVDVADGPGTVGVYTIPNDENIIDGILPAPFPGNIEELLRIQTNTYIQTERPLGSLSVAVVSSKPSTEAITISVLAKDDTTISTSDISDAIEAELNLMEPGETLYLDTLKGICYTYGCKKATIAAPAADVAVAYTLFTRPGTITITEA